MSTNIDHEALENGTPATRAYYDNKPLFYRNIFWYLFGNAAGAMGFNTAQSLMPMHMAKIGMNPEQISGAMAARSWIYLFLCLYIAHVSDTWQSPWGRRLPFLAFSLPFLIVGMIAFPFLQSAVGCMVLFTVFAIFVGIKYDTYPLLSYDLARQRYWGRIAGIGGVIGGLGVWLGQIYLMPMIDTHGEKIAYFLGAMVLLVSTLLTLIFVKEPPIRTPGPVLWNPVRVIGSTLKVGFAHKRNAWLFLAFCVTCSPSLVLGYIAVQGQVNLHMTQGQVGTQLLQWGTLVSLALSPVFGWMIDKLGAVRTMKLGYLLCLAATFFGYHPASVTHLAIASVLVTAGFGALYGAGTIFVASGVERKHIATFCACNGAMTQAYGAISLMVSGVLIKRVFDGNYGAAFLISIIAASLGMPLLIWQEARRRREPRVSVQAEPVMAQSTIKTEIENQCT